MVAPITSLISDTPLVDESARIPGELHAHSKVCELDTIGDARHALARLRELRRDFEGCVKESQSACGKHCSEPLPGNGEEMLAGLSNVQRMRTIRKEISYLEDLMVQIAAHDFEVEEMRYQSYLAGIGQWTMRGDAQHPVI